MSDIIFTSGTTGAPKGVMLTHGQSIRAFDAFNAGFGLRDGDRYLVAPPFFHCFGYKAGWMLALMTGATTYPVAVFDARSMVEQIERDRITVITGAPTLITGMLDLLRAEAHDVSSLRYAFVSAAAVPYELVVRMRAELPVEAVGTGYGLTEATAMVSNTGYDDGPDVVARCSGRPIPGIEVKAVDADGHTVAQGTAGEILVRGFNVMRGYFEDPEATRAVIDGDGWLHTGDVGIIGDDGYLTITDRLKDMFIVGGFNAYPAEIENLLLGDDRIAQVAVVGVPDERLGEVGAAFVVPRPGTDLSPADVVEWARAHMANFKVPRHVELVDALPLNATGKVLKHELRARWSSVSYAGLRYGHLTSDDARGRSRIASGWLLPRPHWRSRPAVRRRDLRTPSLTASVREACRAVGFGGSECVDPLGRHAVQVPRWRTGRRRAEFCGEGVVFHPCRPTTLAGDGGDALEVAGIGDAIGATFDGDVERFRRDAHRAFGIRGEVLGLARARARREVERPVVPERADRHDMRRAVGVDRREPRGVPIRTTRVRRLRETAVEVVTHSLPWDRWRVVAVEVLLLLGIAASHRIAPFAVRQRSTDRG